VIKFGDACQTAWEVVGVQIYIKYLTFGCLVLFFLCQSVMTWGQSDHTKRLIEGAKKEGKVVWYTALSIQDAELLTKRFEQLYPFVKTETLRLVTDSLLTKILTEARAGVFNADVIEIPGIAGNIVKKEGLLAKYASPEAEAYPGLHERFGRHLDQLFYPHAGARVQQSASQKRRSTS